MNKKGLLIVFEGIDGSGKTTLAKLLTDRLAAKGHNVLFTYEPTSGRWGTELRKSFTANQRLGPEKELDLFLRDRKEHVEQVIRPKLEKGYIIICDRYYYSTMAYQGARGMDPSLIEKSNEAFAPKPDILFLLKINPENALKRIQQRRKEVPNNFEKLDYLQKVDEIFDDLTGEHIVRISAEQPIDRSLEIIMAVLKERFSLNSH